MEGHACEHCGVKASDRTHVFVMMKPGDDGVPWYLCRQCWADGIHPMKMGKVKVDASKPVKPPPKTKPRTSRGSPSPR